MLRRIQPAGIVVKADLLYDSEPLVVQRILRRTVPGNLLAQQVLQRLLRAAQLLGKSGRRKRCGRRMMHPMASNLMAAAIQIQQRFARLLRQLPQHEKSCLNAMPVEHFGIVDEAVQH